MPDSPARKPADESAAARNPDRSDELAEGKSRASGQDPDVHPAITHFHSEFKGQSTDLYTDGTQWALGNQPPKEDLSAGRRETPERLPTGEDLVESAGEESSLSEKLRREIYEEAEDLTDAIETNTNNAYDVFAPPQTGSHQETPGPEPHFTTQQHPGMDLGTGVTALFVLGVTIDRGARWVMQHLEKHPEGD